MKIFQKKSVAILLAIVMIVAGIGIGQMRANSAPEVPTTEVEASPTSTGAFACPSRTPTTMANTMTTAATERFWNIFIGLSF